MVLVSDRSVPERSRVADWAFEEIRRALLDGDLQSGDHLSVPSLAAQLQLSRTPVREAVQRLVREGLATETPHRGAVVADYGAAQMVAIYEIREVLEGLVARLAADRADVSLVEELTASHERHRDAVDRGDLPGHVSEDLGFHRRLREAAGNLWLSELLDQITGRIQLAMRYTSLDGGREQSLEEHERILRAVCANDADEAELAARAHIARLRRSLAERVSSSAESPAEDAVERVIGGTVAP